jgi:hypothetical protein
LLTITLAAFRKSRSKTSALASFAGLIPARAALATRSAIALAATAAPSPLEKSLTIRAGSGQFQKASLVSCSAIYLKEAADSDVI